MELKLNIYKGKEVEKTYTADEFDIMFGTVEDVVALIDVGKFSEEAKDMDFVKAAAELITGGIAQVKNLLKEVFPEVTDEELKRVKTKEMIRLMVDLIKYSFTGLSTLSAKK